MIIKNCSILARLTPFLDFQRRHTILFPWLLDSQPLYNTLTPNSCDSTPNPNKHHQTPAKGQMIHQAENIGQHKGQNP